MKKIPNSQRLSYFQQVVISGSLRGAAEVLGIDASSISRAITQLENETGLQLLQRQGRGVIPTAEGLLLANYAQQQIRLSDELYQQIFELKKASRGSINLGLGEGMLDIFFYPVITQFMAKNPNITVNLVVSSSQQLTQDLIDDQLDFALLYQTNQDVRLRSQHAWASSPIQAIVHKEHPLCQIQRPLYLADLSPHNGATLHKNFGLRQFIKRAEEKENIRLTFNLETSSYRALWQYAYAGLGYILSGTSFAHTFRMPELVMLPMASSILNSCGIETITRQGKHLSPAAQALLLHLKEHIPSYATVPASA